MNIIKILLFLKDGDPNRQLLINFLEANITHRHNEDIYSFLGRHNKAVVHQDLKKVLHDSEIELALTNERNFYTHAKAQS